MVTNQRARYLKNHNVTVYVFIQFNELFVIMYMLFARVTCYADFPFVRTEQQLVGQPVRRKTKTITYCRKAKNRKFRIPSQNSNCQNAGRWLQLTFLSINCFGFQFI